MSLNLLLRFSAVSVAFVALPASAINLLQPSDRILAIDTDPGTSSSSYPDPGEAPGKVIDGDYGTKYLNFGKEGSGYIMTLPSAQAFQGLWLSTANDSTERDPVRIAVYGTNSAILSTNNSAGTAESWTLLSRQSVALTDTRNVANASFMGWANPTAYLSYRFVVETLKNTTAANSMQIAETRYSLDSAGANIGSTAGANIFAIDFPVSLSGSRYPGGETPQMALDGVSTSKYLNFGKENSGFIITPGVGSSIVNSITLTTANDAEERDPATYSLYGTNGTITSLDNSFGTDEAWTLISSGAFSHDPTRQTLLPSVSFANNTAYTSYRLVFNTLYNGPATDSMQIADVQFGGTVVPEPASVGLLALGSLLFAGRRRRSAV